MLDGKKLSEMIRKKKREQGGADLRQDMDYAGQDAVDPNVAWDDQKAMEVNEATGDEDHSPATDAEMGENESSQDVAQLKKSMARIARYIESL